MYDRASRLRSTIANLPENVQKKVKVKSTYLQSTCMKLLMIRKMRVRIEADGWLLTLNTEN